MCGIFGIYACDDVLPELITALTTLQHRGQDAAGIVTLNYSFHIQKSCGLVNQVFTKANTIHLRGNIGVGHIRYSTQGVIDPFDAQPFTVNYPFGLAMVHNGNVTNFLELKKTLVKQHHRLIESSNDIELLLYTFAIELAKRNLQSLSVDDIFDSVSAVQEKVHGAYATITLIANHGILAFMDPQAIRPLTLGRKETENGVSFAFASESTCFDYLGYEVIHHLKAGEAIFIDKNKKIHAKICYAKKQAFCVFEYIYFAKEDTIMHDRLVAFEREKMGRVLAKQFQERNLKPDIVIDVPTSAYFCAQGLADALGIKYRKGFVKNNLNKRSFITPNQKLRENIVMQKLNPIIAIVEGKNVAVVDDSIVRGTTSRRIVQMLRNAGAKDIYFASASPPMKYPCVYGIDMSSKKEMIAAKCSIEEMTNFIQADALVYPTLENFFSQFEGFDLCDACITGKYPTYITDEVFDSIEQEKITACR